jgi:hypothetical protein
MDPIELIMSLFGSKPQTPMQSPGTAEMNPARPNPDGRKHPGELMRMHEGDHTGPMGYVDNPMLTRPEQFLLAAYLRNNGTAGRDIMLPREAPREPAGTFGYTTPEGGMMRFPTGRR